LGEALKDSARVIKTTCSQTDLAATLLSQLGLPHQNFPLSKNILSTKVTPFAYFAFNEGFGFVTPTDSVVYDLVGQKYIKESGSNPEPTKIDSWAFFTNYQDIFSGL